MENWDVYVFVQFLFNIEIFWCFNVFEVNVVKGWFQCCDYVDKFVWVKFIGFNVKYIDVGEFFKQNVFVFYDWFVGQCVDVV